MFSLPEDINMGLFHLTPIHEMSAKIPHVTDQPCASCLGWCRITNRRLHAEMGRTYAACIPLCIVSPVEVLLLQASHAGSKPLKKFDLGLTGCLSQDQAAHCTYAKKAQPAAAIMPSRSGSDPPFIMPSVGSNAVSIIITCSKIYTTKLASRGCEA